MTTDYMLMRIRDYINELEKKNTALEEQLSHQNSVFIRETAKIIGYLPKGYKFDMEWREN